MYQISRYTFIFNRDKHNFIYNSRINNFYEIPDAALCLLDQLSNLKLSECTNEEVDFLESLIRNKIIVEKGEDDLYFDELNVLYNIQANSTSTLHLTIVPTILCNLRCPYCFEESKPKGFMSDKVINSVVDFIKHKHWTNKYSISWFGGEPLLAINQIEKTLELLHQERDLELTHHSIITNGTLLGHKAIEVFQKFPLDSIQITLDGFKESHDRKRHDEGNQGTFDKIINNVKNFTKCSPNTFVSFRINVDNSNYREYVTAHKYLKEMFKNDNVGIYAGILRANKGCESDTFFTSRDHLKFNDYLLKNKIPLQNFPQKCSKGCTATQVASFIIGPKGELYLCWEHVGKEDKIIGYIGNKKNGNYCGLSNYMLYGHCYSDSKCKKCGFVPICSGGCPDKRIENKFNGGNYDLCSIYHEEDGQALNDLLYKFYQSQQEE